MSIALIACTHKHEILAMMSMQLQFNVVTLARIDSE